MKFISFLVLIFLAIDSIVAVIKCEKDFFTTKFSNNQNNELTVLLLWFPANAGSLSKINLCSRETGLSLQRHCAYNRHNNTGVWEEINDNIQLIDCDSFENTCHKEPFHHNYIMRNGLLKPFNNTWKTSKIMETADLEEPCLLRNGLPVTRLCQFSPQFKSAMWEPLRPDLRNVSCLKETYERVITYDLNTLYQNVIENETLNITEPVTVLKNMTELLKRSHTVRLPADIKITSEILKIVIQDNADPEILTQVLNATNIIANMDARIILKSEEIKATTDLLKTIDKYLYNLGPKLVPTHRCHNITDGIFYKRVDHTSVFYINPSCSNISGLAVYHRHHSNHQYFDRHTENYYRFLYLNQTLEEITNEPDLNMAVYFPQSLWNKLKNETDVAAGKTVMAFTIFPNDKLFVNRSKMDYKPAYRVLEITLTNYSGELPEDIPFIFGYQRQRMRTQPKCGYWNFNTWITNGVRTEYNSTAHNDLLICHSSHLSHFALMFRTTEFPSLSFGDTIMLSITHDIMLDYISITGCGLSLIGLTCIWLTAICFRSWRSQLSIKILLNICLVLTLIMLYFLFLNIPQLWNKFIDMGNIVHCMLMGIFLHYNIMVLFCWMLIIAIMQYQRYVKIVGYERSSNFLVKYSIAAWCLPMIPVGLVAFLQPKTYLPNPEKIANNTAICYPTGNSLYYGVLLPMAVIMSTNLLIFVWIFYSLHRSLGQFKQRSEKKRILLQVRTAVLLFFLMGISWIFGLLSYMDSDTPVFSYIFCLTSTLQGFVLFIFSIVIERTTRILWVIFCCANSYDTMEGKNLELTQVSGSK
ncbi:adhesion G-protein coupled receptor G2-like [Cochliomyia hominivorax]